MTLGSVGGGRPRKGMVSLRGLCSELVAVDFVGLCAGLPWGSRNGCGFTAEEVFWCLKGWGRGRGGRDLLSS